MEWHYALLNPADPNLRYAHTLPLLDASGYTLKIGDAVARLDAGYQPPDPSVGLHRASELLPAIKDGTVFPPPIVIGTTDGSWIMLVEGHTRMTAYFMAELPEVAVIYGSTTPHELLSWRFATPHELC